MNNTEIVDALALGVFLAFAAMLFIAWASLTVRIVRWHKRRVEMPLLLYRDFGTFSGLSFSFLAISVSRAIELPMTYTRTVPWIVFTSAPALFGVAIFLYFEFFVIGRRD